MRALFGLAMMVALLAAAVIGALLGAPANSDSFVGSLDASDALFVIALATVCEETYFDLTTISILSHFILCKTASPSFEISSF